ncbi:MAG: hypothetical protein KC931_07970 [Candidatus Omnitrophica bacterium]|nr:hypothetical protein [Candidatus Omnitrophota bacterium]MCA9436540.1 hypothetical protein [Candidatus Omnitrophota bacterium]MCA9447037.1 hypothetical protein [Candidatus Omnitrophota bacterium]
MNTRVELLVYTLLILMAAVASYFLVTDVLAARVERAEDESNGVEIFVEATPASLDPTPLETAIAVFRERDLFADLVTPLPTPTKEILPTPTPTIEPMPQNWSVANILGGEGKRIAQIVTGDGKKRVYREGDFVPYMSRSWTDAAVSFGILKIEEDRVLLIRKNDLQLGWLYMGGGAQLETQLPEGAKLPPGVTLP